ncbi:MAG TPA: zf-HC2 domain-containing protein [Gemmatimonadales bacterium]|nr:zf-HC2 domain-containing protein [Gemmatimonadales bacterium]
MPHVDEATLHAYLDQQLEPRDRRDVELHLQDCATCRAQLEEERALSIRAAAILERAAPPREIRAGTGPKPRRLWPSIRLPLAWAATVTIAFVMGRYLEAGRIGGSLDQRMMTPAPSPSSPTTATPRPPSTTAKTAAAPPRSQPNRDELRAAAPRAAAPSVGAEPPSAATMNADMGAREPAHVPGLPVLRTYASGEATVVEQQLEGGTVIRLYEYPPGPVAQAARPTERAAAPRAGAGAAPEVATRSDAPANASGERLARYVGNTRVEIEGPVGSDSLERLLEKVR